MEYHFNTDVAKRFGSDAATIIANLAFWQKKNEANEKNCHDGKYWSYNSVKAFSELFPWISETKMRRILDKLVSEDVLECGNYNKLKIDRTKWYTIIDESICQIYQLHLATATNGIGTSDEPIPYSKPNNKPDNKIYRKSGKHQITVKEVEKLKDNFLLSKAEVDDLIDGFLNYSSKNKYVSIYRTILKWYKKTDKYKEDYAKTKKFIKVMIERGTLDGQLNVILKNNAFSKYVYDREFK